jgi:phenylacetic acid degradation operon negative regulatory protein
MSAQRDPGPEGAPAVRSGSEDSGDPSAPGVSGAESDEAAFADYVRVLTDWRRLPFLDPGLPAELLPGDWHGSRAADLFDALRSRLAGPAHQHVLAVTGIAAPG